MPLDPAYFRDYQDLSEGDLVRFTTKDRDGKAVHGVGVVKLVWLGIEEMCRVVTPEGEVIQLCRAIGDLVEKVPLT